MTAVDAAIVLAFAAYAVVAGLRSRRLASRNLEEYFLAGRSLSGWRAGISMAATQFAADTPLLVTGLIATAGIFALWRLWIYALAFLLLGFVLAPSWRRVRVLTDAELTEIRYASRPAAALRALKAIYFGTIFNCTVLAMVLFAAKEIAEPFLLWDRWLPEALFDAARTLVHGVGVPFARDNAAGDLWIRSTNNLLSIAAIVGVTILYSATGGLRGVVRTDLVQFALMIAGTLVYAVIVVGEVGGLAALPTRVGEAVAGTGIRPEQVLAFTPSRARDASLALLAVFGLQWLVQMNADGTGYLAQRVMACRSDRDAKQAAVVFVGAQILLRSLLWLPIGLGLLVIFPPGTGTIVAAEREASFVRGMAELLPPGARGLMLTAMLAALASTVDTHLNWGASYWTNDLYKRFVCEAWRGRRASDRSLVWVARLSTGIILAVALVIMTRLDSIQLAWRASLLLGAGMGVLLVLRWIWWRISGWGEIAAISASLVMAPLLLRFAPTDAEATTLLALAAVSTLAGVGASLLAGPEPREQLLRFYARARPPGFWGPIARAAGDDPGAAPRRLARGLAATGLGALCVFCGLTGLGAWLVGSPAPVAWPGPRVTWIAALLVVGVGLLPWVWRLGFAGARTDDA